MKRTTVGKTLEAGIEEPVEVAPPRLGLRERNKLDKMNRIRSAALELFQTKGFDATTTREIAELADVGIGTVFMYAEDKRDLLFLVFNDELDLLVDKAFGGVNRRQPLSIQVHEAFTHFYAAFHERATLARLLLKELVFFSAGKQVGQFMENRLRILSRIEELIRDAIAKGSLHADEDPALIANAFFFLYSGEVRLWLSDGEPGLAQGLASLKKTFMLLGRGLGEDAAVQKPSGAGKGAAKNAPKSPMAGGAKTAPARTVRKAAN